MMIRFITLCFFLFTEVTLGHGRSEEMEKILNTPAPDWMSIAEEINVSPLDFEIKDISLENYFEKEGGATNSRNRIYITHRDLIFEVDYPMNWTAGNKQGKGVSLSPDGNKLITSSGKEPYFHLYNINNDQLSEVDIKLPRVTYDEGEKGFITKWSWVSNNVLIGSAVITNHGGDKLIESRIYAFNLESSSLARLNLSGLNLSEDDPPIITIDHISKDLKKLVLSINGVKSLVEANLKEPHRFKSIMDSTTNSLVKSSISELEKEKEIEKLKKDHVPTKDRKRQTPHLLWLIVVLLLAIVFYILKNKSKD